MSHPERCAEDVLGGEDGRLFFVSMLDALKKANGQPNPAFSKLIGGVDW